MDYRAELAMTAVGAEFLLTKFFCFFLFTKRRLTLRVMQQG